MARRGTRSATMVASSAFLSAAAAFRALLSDDDYQTLLRAEKMDTMPKFIVERTKKSP